MTYASRILNFSQYLLRAKNSYALHSPFVYQLYTQVITPNKNYYAFSQINALHQKLKSNQEVIQTLDLGAKGIMKTRGIYQEKIIAQIAKKTSVPQNIGKMLFQLVDFLQAKNIIELGTSLGISTAYLSKPSSESIIESFEACPNTAQIAKENLKSLGISNTNIHIGDIKDTLPQVLGKYKKIDFAFLDANHRYTPTMQYFEILLPKAHENTCLVFDDIYWSEEMQKAWEELKKTPKVTLSIDLYRVGLLFFRKKQVKQDFTLYFPPF